MYNSRLFEGAGRFRTGVLCSEEFGWKKRELGWVLSKNWGWEMKRKSGHRQKKEKGKQRFPA